MAPKDYRKEFDELFKNLKDDVAEDLEKSTLKMIDHVHTRVAYTERKKKDALELGLALLTISVALGGFLREFNTDLLNFLAPFLAGLFLTSTIELSLYVWQARFKRPFVENAKTWRWFYHYCINPELPVGPYLCKEQRKKSKDGYLEGLYHYTKNTLSLNNHQKRLRQDIEQLFILLTGERLKNEFLKQLQGIVGYGIFASLIGLGINIISNYLFSINVSIIIGITGFGVTFTIFYLRKVFPTTKSRENWNYIDE